jgi:hypothetical protein
VKYTLTTHTRYDYDVRGEKPLVIEYDKQKLVSVARWCDMRKAHKMREAQEARECARVCASEARRERKLREAHKCAQVCASGVGTAREVLENA